jgi:uncharacterized membrane protein
MIYPLCFSLMGTRMNTENNTSNPRNSQQERGKRTTHQPVRKMSDIMPSPELLESYDYVVEGSAARIMEMFTREQQHRHEWEMKALKTHHFSTLLGQFLGFLICVSVFVSATIIGVYGDKTIAAVIWVFGLAIIVMSGLVWMYAKTLGQRPLFGRPQMRSHFRPMKEKEMPIPPNEDASAP